MTIFANISTEKKRILIFGSVILFMGAIYRFWPNLVSLTDYSEEIHQKKRQITKYQEISLEKKPLEKHLLDLARNLERAESRLFNRNTPALAAVDIQSMINEILGRVDLKPDRTIVLKPVEIEASPYRRIGVEVTFTADAPKLKQVLYRLESSSKILTIRSLTINSRQSGKEDKTPLAIQMVVEGIMIDNSSPSEEV